MFALEGTWLFLYPRQALAEDAGVSHVGEGFRAVTLAHNAGSKAWSTPRSPSASAAAQRPSSSRKTSSGAATAVTSPIPTGTLGSGLQSVPRSDLRELQAARPLPARYGFAPDVLGAAEKLTVQSHPFEPVVQAQRVGETDPAVNPR